MVARFNRGLRPINRIKHVVDSQTALPVNTQLNVGIALANDAPVIGSPAQCITGSMVNSFFASVECVASESSTTATANIYIMFVKNPGDNLTFPNANAVGSDDNKRFVFHQEMNMINPTDGGNPRNLFKGVIKVPKHLRRMGPSDKIQMLMFIPSTGVAVNICSQFHYKEFR